MFIELNVNVEQHVSTHVITFRLYNFLTEAEIAKF
jgi:hypothetical protein